jgi:uncharacterized protein YbjT (DUF2867 family)
MPNTFLITGASGNVGKAVIQALKNCPFKIRAAVQSSSSLDAFRAQGIDAIQMDFADPSSIRAALQDVSAAFFMVPMVPSMVELAANFIQAAQEVKLPFIARLSGFGADLAAPIELLQKHGQIDQMLKESALPAAILRPNSFMQNFSTLNVRSIQTENKIYLPLGEGKASYIDVRDIAAVVVEMFLKPEAYQDKTFDLTGPEALSCAQIAAILSETLNTPNSYIDLPAETAAAAMRQAGVPEWGVKVVSELYGQMKAGHASAVSSAVETITGQKAIPFQQFAREHAHVFKPRTPEPV